MASVAETPGVVFRLVRVSLVSTYCLRRGFGGLRPGFQLHWKGP